MGRDEVLNGVIQSLDPVKLFENRIEVLCFTRQVRSTGISPTGTSDL